jgi:hypothetical protein
MIKIYNATALTPTVQAAVFVALKLNAKYVLTGQSAFIDTNPPVLTVDDDTPFQAVDVEIRIFPTKLVLATAPTVCAVLVET